MGRGGGVCWLGQMPNFFRKSNLKAPLMTFPNRGLLLLSKKSVHMVLATIDHKNCKWSFVDGKLLTNHVEFRQRLDWVRLPFETIFSGKPYPVGWPIYLYPNWQSGQLIWSKWVDKKSKQPPTFPLSPLFWREIFCNIFLGAIGEIIKKILLVNLYF